MRASSIALALVVLCDECAAAFDVRLGGGVHMTLLPPTPTPGRSGGAHALAVAPTSSLGAALRSDFPTLDQMVWEDKPLVYLDSGATSQKPASVLNAMRLHLEHDNANVHRGAHLLSARSTEAYEGARDKVARFVNAADRREVIFTRGATEAINLVAGSWGSRLKEGDEVIVSVMEHQCARPHSRAHAWWQVAGWPLAVRRGISRARRA